LTLEEFDKFLADHPEVEFQPVKKVDSDGNVGVEAAEVEDSTGMAFRVGGFRWYDNYPNNITYVDNSVLRYISPHDLYEELTRGLYMEQITRITGYFTKVEQWNKGKLGELRDRDKVNGQKFFLGRDVTPESIRGRRTAVNIG